MTDLMSFRFRTFSATICPAKMYTLPAAKARKLLRLIHLAEDPESYRYFGLLIQSAVENSRWALLDEVSRSSAEDPREHELRWKWMKNRADKTKKIYQLYLEELKK